MCLIDTIDGALMLTLYILPAGTDKTTDSPTGGVVGSPTLPARARDPVTFLYYSIVLTFLTVIVALVIGVLQLLTLVLNVTAAKGPFWDGVQVAGDNYDIIGGAICGSFIVVGGASVLAYRPWRRRVDRQRVQQR